MTERTNHDRPNRQDKTNGPEDSWVPMRTGDVDKETLKELTSMIDLLPLLPGHVHEILRIVSGYESSAKEVEKLISSDPVIASKVLKTVDSAYYGITKKTENILQAAG